MLDIERELKRVENSLSRLSSDIYYIVKKYPDAKRELNNLDSEINSIERDVHKLRNEVRKM